MLSGTQIPDKSTLPSAARGVGPEGGAGGLRATTAGTPFFVWPLDVETNSEHIASATANRRRQTTHSDGLPHSFSVLICQCRHRDAPDPDYFRCTRTRSFRSRSRAWKFC